MNLARSLEGEAFPTMEELERLVPDEARKRLLELPGIGDYSADIINPHGGFPIDAWSVEVFRKLLYGEVPGDRREAIEGIKREGQAPVGQMVLDGFLLCSAGSGESIKKAEYQAQAGMINYRLRCVPRVRVSSRWSDRLVQSYS